jgi:hypothetical protein
VATRQASLRVRIGAAVAAGLLLIGIVASLFGGGSNQSATTSTTPPTAPPVTITDAEYQRIAGGISTLIEQAGTQRCPLITAFTGFGELPDPSNAEQVRVAMSITVALLNATAASTDPDEATNAEVINSTAAALEAEAEAAGYAPEWIRSPEGNQTLAAPEFVAAFEAYQTRTEQLCLSAAPEDPTPGSPATTTEPPG